jgi:NhaP-type Na+/H+ or K+/H+ antiporter
VNQALLLVALFGGVIVSAIVAQRLRIPYPIAFVVIGLAFALVPGLPAPHLNPQLLFLLVLPPLLFSGGWNTDWYEFKRNFTSISLLAVGLVLFTTVVVAVLAHQGRGIRLGDGVCTWRDRLATGCRCRRSDLRAYGGAAAHRCRS